MQAKISMVSNGKCFLVGWEVNILFLYENLMDTSLYHIFNKLLLDISIP